jgi:hypothetical protein
MAFAILPASAMGLSVVSKSISAVGLPAVVAMGYTTMSISDNKKFKGTA